MTAMQVPDDDAKLLALTDQVVELAGQLRSAALNDGIDVMVRLAEQLKTTVAQVAYRMGELYVAASRSDE